MSVRNATIKQVPKHWLSALKLAPLVGAGAWQMAAALAMPELWWLRYVALVPLFVAVRFLSATPAAALGALWGAGVFLFAQGEPSAGIHPSAWLLLTVIPAGFAWVSAELTRRKGFNPLLLGLCWAMVELIVAPLATKHGLLASTRGDGVVAPALEHLAGGSVLTAFILAAVNAFLVSALIQIEQAVSGSPLVSIPIGPDWICDGFEDRFERRFFAPRIQPRAPPYATWNSRSFVQVR